MLKTFWRFMSDMCWRVGAERLSMRFLLMSLETKETVTPVIALQNRPPIIVPEGPFDIKVLWEDRPLIQELAGRCNNDISIAKHVHDIN